MKDSYQLATRGTRVCTPEAGNVITGISDARIRIQLGSMDSNGAWKSIMNRLQKHLAGVLLAAWVLPRA